jgi:hypothetical protein
MQTFAHRCGEALTHDQFGATATNIHHEAPSILRSQAVGHAQIDEPSLLSAGDHFDRMAQGALGALDEIGVIAKLTQGVGPYGAHAALGHGTYPLAESFKASQGTVFYFGA